MNAEKRRFFAGKTQRDKDWPMITRLVEVDYAAHLAIPPPGRIAFWLREMRTPELLVSLAAQHSDLAKAAKRPLVALAAAGDITGLGSALRAEEDAEREADRRYWEPLKAELAQLRQAKRSFGRPSAASGRRPGAILQFAMFNGQFAIVPSPTHASGPIAN